jgi:type I restriction enzyme M protein
LIDASDWYSPLRKNLGKKNCEFSEEHIKKISELIIAYKETENSKIFPNKAFGYHKITVERPLRLKVDLSKKALKHFRKVCEKEDETNLANLVEYIAEEMDSDICMDFNAIRRAVKKNCDEFDVRYAKKRMRLIQSELTVVDETAEPVIKKRKTAKRSSNVLQQGGLAPLYGKYTKEIDGKMYTVEYESDTNLRDTEQIPLLEEGGIEGFFRREVLPYVPDAWIDETKTQIGYEISFTRYFYKPPTLRSLEEITADIKALEQETDGLLQKIVGEGV